jgi:hypothetical protein
VEKKYPSLGWNILQLVACREHRPSVIPNQQSELQIRLVTLEVEVTLRLAVIQSVSTFWSQAQCGTCDQIFCLNFAV